MNPSQRFGRYSEKVARFNKENRCFEKKMAGYFKKMEILLLIQSYIEKPGLFFKKI